MWVRPAVAETRDDLMEFQFTHPCGCDHLIIFDVGYLESFNSRTRVGATELTQKQKRIVTGFNSRTRVGATA